MTATAGRRRRILVSGAGGFVGAAVVATASARGWPVRAAARGALPPGVNATEVVSGAVLAGDADWRACVAGVETVVHCAARAHVLRESAADPLAAFRAVNVEGTLALARQAAAEGVRRFVFVSTIGVNGVETVGRPYRADDAPSPQTPYARSKYEAECGLRELAEGCDMELVIVRPPLVHGPAAPGNFGRLLNVVARGVPLPLASVDNRRSLIGLANLADLLVRCVDHPAAAGQTLLASDGDDVSTPSLLRRVAAALGVPSRLFAFPVAALRAAARLSGRAGLVQQLCASLQIDDAPTRERLGWTPLWSLDAGLAHAARPLCGGIGAASTLPSPR